MDEKTKTVALILVAVVWRQKIVSIAVHIAKQSKRARNFPVSVGIRNVLGKLVKRTKHRLSPRGCAIQQALFFGLKARSLAVVSGAAASSVDAAGRETINGRMRMQQQKTRARGGLSSSDYRSERFL